MANFFKILYICFFIFVPVCLFGYQDCSRFQYDVDVNDNDDIITVKTCTRMFGLDEKQQFQIDARLVRDNEEMYKYKVTKTKLYKEYNLNDSYK